MAYTIDADSMSLTIVSSSFYAVGGTRGRKRRFVARLAARDDATNRSPAPAKGVHITPPEVLICSCRDRELECPERSMRFARQWLFCRLRQLPDNGSTPPGPPQSDDSWSKPPQGSNKHPQISRPFGQLASDAGWQRRIVWSSNPVIPEDTRSRRH